MPEIRKTVVPIEINYGCDDCSKKPNPGCLLKRNDFVYLTNPPRYEYFCPLCDKKYVFNEIYPKIIFEEEEE